MPYQSVPSRLGFLLLALLAGGCGSPEPGPTAARSELLEARPWIAGGRRAALRGPEPGASLTFGVPNGSKRVSLSVSALRTGRQPFRRAAAVTLRAGTLSTQARAPVRPADSASWLRLELELPRGEVSQHALEWAVSDCSIDLSRQEL